MRFFSKRYRLPLYISSSLRLLVNLESLKLNTVNSKVEQKFTYNTVIGSLISWFISSQQQATDKAQVR